MFFLTLTHNFGNQLGLKNVNCNLPKKWTVIYELINILVNEMRNIQEKNIMKKEVTKYLLDSNET